MAGMFFSACDFARRGGVLFYQAAAEIPVGTDWAAQVCSTSQMFCHHPEYLAYAGGALLIVAIGVKLGSIANG